MDDRRSEGGVVIPGNFPVSADDPTKGNITPVLNAQQLTAGVLQLTAMVEGLQTALYGVAEHQRNVTSETADLLEYIGTLITEFNEDKDLTDEQDEAYQALKGFVDARRALRAELEAERAENSVEGHEVLGRDEEGGDFTSEAPE